MNNKMKILRRHITILILLLLGCMFSKALGADVKYYIINNDGKVCFQYVIKDNLTYTSIDKTELCVHPHARSIFATNFRFYLTIEDAKADAGGDLGRQHFGEGTSISAETTGTGPFYVRYDMKSGDDLPKIGDIPIDITGDMSYLMQIRERYTGKGYGRRRQVYYDNSADKRFEFFKPSANETDIPDPDPASEDGGEGHLQTGLQYRFRFVANGDPYNIYIYNGTAEGTNPNGVMTLPNIGTSVKEVQRITYVNKISDYDPETTANLQTFFLTAPDDNIMETDWKSNWSGKYFIVGAYGGIECWMRDKGNYTVKSDDEKNMPYMLCAMGSTGTFNPDPGFQLQAFRSWRNDDPRISNTALVKLYTNEPTHVVKYHIVNSADPTEDVLTIVQRHGQSSVYSLSNRTKLQRLGCTLSTDYYSARDCAEAHKLDSDAKVGTATDVYIPYTFNTTDEEKAAMTATGLEFSTEDDPKWFSMDIKESSTRLLTYNATNNVISSNTGPTADRRILQESQYAFIGDPYSFRIICKGAEGKYAYVDPEATPTSNGDYVRFAASPTDDMDCWAMVSGTTTNSFQIFRRDAYDVTYRAFWKARGGGNEIRMQAQTKNNEKVAESNIHVTPTPTYNYTYNIVDNKGRIAIKYTVNQDVSRSLVGKHGHEALPEAITSPYIEDETLTFYKTYTASTSTVSNPITMLPKGADNDNTNIYVRYTNNRLSTKRLVLDGSRSYFMQLGDKYVITTYSAQNEKTSVATQAGRPTVEEDGKELKIWTLSNSDPYDVEIRNTGTGNHKLLDNTDENIHFILMSGTSEEKVELLFANQKDISTPANSESLDVNGGTVSKITTDRGSTNQQAIFSVAALERTYRLLDKQGKILLEYDSKDLTNGNSLGILDKWVSPLVERYHYWNRGSFDLSGDTYTFREGASEINSPTGSTDGYIYVTYDVAENNIITKVDPTARVHQNGSATGVFVRDYENRWGQIFMIKFANGESFYQERGDSLRDEMMQAVYPYANGDSGFNLYGDTKWDEDKAGASSTRTRWSWYVVSENNDPYRVKITSWQQCHSRKLNSSDAVNTSFYNYWRTYYESVVGSILTGTISDDPQILDDSKTGGSASNAPSEYMLLGTTGHYNLVTVDEIDGGVAAHTKYGKHRPVNDFLQYWKTYETISRKGVKPKNGTALKWDEFQSQTENPYSFFTATNVAAHPMYRFKAWQNARPITADDPTKSNSKKYEYTYHYYQKISLGETLDFVEHSIDGIMILLDKHGWEIFRKPMAKTGDANKATRDAAIRQFDSPMVKTYHFWSTATKTSGYHKYANWETEKGTGSSLGDYPEVLNNNGNVSDLYVTYDVKPEYEELYTVTATKDGDKVTSVSGTVDTGKTFIIRQDSKLAYADTDNNGNLAADDNATNITNIDTGQPLTGLGTNYYWYLAPNWDIDKEMGYVYNTGTKTDAKENEDVEQTSDGLHKPRTETETRIAYYKTDRAGFDPYNIQIYNQSTGKYFTTNASYSRLDETNAMKATFPNADPTANTVALADHHAVNTSAKNGEGHDGANLHMTNQTFMVVSDANGNMRLMPRFDHYHAIEDFITLTKWAADKPEDDKTHGQSTWLIRPTVYTYIVVDNAGREALQFTQYTSGAPKMSSIFTSPLAKNFTFYKGLTLADGVYTEVANGTDISSKKISGSLAEAGYTSTTDHNVYVRYDYDTEVDTDGLLKGTWYNAKIYDGSADVDIKVTSSSIAKEPYANDPDHRLRFMKSAGDARDPYAVTLWNGNKQNPNTEGNRYIVIEHSSGTGYALMKAGNTTYPTTNYYFLDGSNSTSGSNATLTLQDNYKTTGTIDATKKLTLIPVLATTQLTYKIITERGKVALTSDTETEITVAYKLKLPDWMHTPLMEDDAYIFYSSAEYDSEKDTYTINSAPTTTPMSLDGDVVYVHYDYEKSKKAVTSFQMADNDAVPFNYAPLDLSGNVMYTIGINSDDYGRLWYVGQNGKIEEYKEYEKKPTELTSYARLWRFTGNDPYEVTIEKPSTTGEKAVLAGKDPISGAVITNNEITTKPNNWYPLVYVKKPGDDGYNDYPYRTFMVLKFHPNEKTTANNRHRAGTLKLYVTGKDNLFMAESGSLAGGVYIYKDDKSYKERLTKEDGGEPLNPILPDINDSANPMIIYSNFFYRPVLTYHVITNDKKEALRGYSLMSGTKVEMPEFYQTPLLNSSDFIYHTKATVDGKDYTVDDKATTTASSTIASVVAKSIGHLYVRYKYDPATSPFKIATSIDDDADDGTRLDWNNEAGLDLTGNTWYTIADMQRNRTSDHGRVFGAESTSTTTYETRPVSTLQNGRAPSQTEYLWRLEGNDPYAIRIYNAKHNKYLSVANSDRKVNLLDKDVTGNNTQTFMLLEAQAHDNRLYVMDDYNLKRWTVLMTTGTTSYYTPCTTSGNGTTSALQARNTWVANNYSEYDIRMSSNKVTTRRILNHGAPGGTTEYCIEFIKAPVSRKYHYHAVNQATGDVTWHAILEHDWLQPVVLEDNIARLFCKYEMRDTLATGSTVTGKNIFKTRAALEKRDNAGAQVPNAQFYHNAGLTERIYDENSKTYDIYPEIGLNDVYDIYFKYQIDTEAKVSGRALSDITSNATQLASDKAHYAEKGQLDQTYYTGDGHGKWFFMVLDTDADMTATGTGNSRTFTGNQYFLRREDDGTVSWMNNDYSLHPKAEDNYNEWSCSRLAEWYRKGDNDAYREGRWLWTFVGDDPYNMRLLNMETLVGVNTNAIGVYALDAADNCWTTISENKLTEQATAYPVVTPTAEPSANQYWGLCAGYDTEQTFSLLSTSMTTTTDGKTINLPLFWNMQSRTANKVTTQSVEGNYRITKDRSNAMQLIPYEPVKYQDINLVIKRDDHVVDYRTWKQNYRDDNKGAEPGDDLKRTQLQSYDSGISLLYFTAAERTYVEGDKIDMTKKESLPYNVRRAFCDYTLYSDDYVTAGGEYIVQDGPYPTSTQATYDNGDPVYDEDGKPVWTYVDKDGNAAPGGAQSIYVEYKVTSDIFLKEAPDYDEVQTMLANNDHVYFMDFPTTDSKGKTITHHAFYDPEATTFIQTGDLSKNKDKNTGVWVPEKKSWNGTTYVSDFTDSYNSLQYRTVNDRMESTPDHLKWYFVGDPYKVQVYNTAGVWNEEALKGEDGNVIKDSEDSSKDAYPANSVNAQLARYNPVETNFQFVSDCVHLRLPDYTKIDKREQLIPTDEYGVAMPDKTFNNRNYNKPYINDFYWEVMPAASDETGTFALRFKEDNELLGYRNVYYYLAREGLTKSYQVEEENPDVYHINLSYNADNERYESGKYLGYHKANNENSTIKLVQPVKVYITANRVDDRFGNKENVVKDEYSGYYGLGETITGVPRHLQRKYVKYNDLTDNDDMTASEHKLIEDKAFNSPLNACIAHSSNVFKTGTKINPVFKFSVNYSVDDLTPDGVHLFTKAANPTAPTQAEITWLDVKISNSSWLYYDKTNKNNSGVENKTDVVSNYRRAMNDPKNQGWNNDADGWNDGLKGLHWAFVGDPYDFTILNRRRYEDNDINTSPMWFAATKRAVDNYNGTATDSIVWTTCLVNAPTAVNTSTATANLEAGSDQNSHWSLQMWKTGGDSDFFLRTASLNQTEYNASPAENAPIADTETDNYWRMAARTSTISDVSYEFEAIPYSLSNKNRWTSNKGYLDWNTYVTNGTGYSQSSSGMGVKEQLIQIGTATNKDNDQADNNCFDAKIQIVTKKGVKRIEKDNLEIKYGIAADMLPYSLRRYGCTYECYINYVSPENPGTLLYRLRDSNEPMDEAESWSTSTQEYDDLTDAITAAKEAHAADPGKSPNVTLTYVYDMEEEVAPYFTTEANALIDEYTWMNTYFEWEQIYTGTNVEVEYYEDVFDHYVYNAQGQIVDAVYVKERKTKIVKNPTTPYITDAFLNSHTTQTAIYADQSVQTEKDQQKWSLVGDPYSFKMINYDQYLKNQNSKLTLDGNNVVASNISSQNFDLPLDAKGNTYLGIFDGTGEDGNADVKHFINFTYSASSDKSLHYENAAVINDNDPTGNTLKTKNIKPFKLANLISYADVLQYHLVIAHQHSLDPSDAHLKYLGTEDATVVEALTEDKATKDKYTADRNTLRDHLVEFLKYQEIRKKLTGDKKYLNGTTSVAGDGTLWIHGREDDIKTLLKQEGSLRDFISYPVVDYNVSRVGIGNHPQVPWYMKRQFCKYYLYQRDVMRSVILDGTYDVNGDGYLKDDDIRYAYLKNDNGEYVDYDGNVVDKGEAIRLWMDEDQTSPAYEILWVSLFDESKWSDWSTDDEADLSAGNIDASRKVEYPAGSGKYKKQPSGYVEGLSQQGQILTTLLPCHKNRKVVIDVVYEVNTDEFQFATSGRNTYAWYQMMTNNASSGMMNFSYKDGIGARTDRATHYTNNYLWAPEGDPYGFVLRSRYATVNGTGWDDVVVTTTGHLPKSTDYSTYDAATVITSDATAFDATYTRRVGNNGGNLFDNKLIIHHLGGEELATNDGPANAIYEMFTGDATYSNSFLMHPTSSYIDLTNTTFQSYYMAHDTQTHKAKLVAGSANTLKNDNDANWRLLTTPEQLWPFFEYSGYVGGLEPLIAQNFSNMELHTQLKEYIDNPLMEREYSVLNRARKLVYTGKFYKRSGGELEASDPRPTAAEDLPVTFVPENLVQMKEGYYRIRGFSTDKLKAAETASGVYGPRYVSGYRFASEVTNNKPLRYFETDQKNATIHTFGALTGFSDAPLQGNIELLPVEYDASSIFRFEALTDANSGVASDAFGRWVFGSQDLRVQVVGTPAENTPATTKMAAGTGTPFRLDDIGGATVTLRTLNGVPTNADATHTWDADENYDVSKNIRTNYLTSNGSNNNSAYSLVVGADNELNQTETTDIQDTKWMLQPIGIRTSWPFNQTPLRVEVKKGGKDKTDKDDKYYYGSLCVPFDSRLGKTTDAAFTLVREMTGQSGTITMPSVSQYNGMGNPQYVPATWPVVMRTNQPGSVQMKNSDNSDYGGTRYYVDMYLPYTSPQTVSKASLNPLLMGEYLERTLDNTYMTGKTSGFTEPITSLKGKTIMVFGLPFKNHATDNHVYDTDAQVGWFKNHNWERETYHSVTANTATDTERNNLYVYNNKVYYVMDTPSAGARELIVALFDEDVEPHEDEPIEETTTTKSVPWPCDVYDVQGRRVARHETPQTLLKNNPSLPKGVYIFGGRKVVIR